MNCPIMCHSRVTITRVIIAAVAFALSAAVAEPPAVLVVPNATDIPESAKERRAVIALADQSSAVTVHDIATAADFRKLLAGTPTTVWLHEGDEPTMPAVFSDAKSLKALNTYVTGGGTLFLSGSTFSLVHYMGVEPAKPRAGGPGNDRNSARIQPTIPTHPIFAGAALGNGREKIVLTDRGYPAFSDFHGSGGPRTGTLLGRAGGENPLVEYAVGKGRIIIMGWRLPHFSNATNKHRSALEALTTNILGYLATRDQWIKLEASEPGKIVRATAATPEGALPEPEALRLAIGDLIATFGEDYPRGKEFLARLDAFEAGDLEDGQFAELKQEALLANPLLDFDALLLIERSGGKVLPKNWQSNSSLRRTGHANAIRILSPVTPDGTLTTLYEPEGGKCVTDLDLDFDAGKLMFSMPGTNGRWQLHELDVPANLEAGPVEVEQVREIATIPDNDVENYDSCYGPDGTIYFTSTATQLGVPCVRGGSHIANIYSLSPDRKRVERLTVDQEHNWCPTMMNDGRVMYQRWEYTDMPHAFYRLMFAMNPDGTGQAAIYGSNSYWPNAMFYSRPVPGSASQFVSIVGGHHDLAREGRLVLFDTSRGRFEADGVVQAVPGYGKPVEPIILDGLTRGRYPRSLHPYPLSDKYFLVASVPRAGAARGIYLVDVFDNFLLLCAVKGREMMEPVPLRRTPRPPLVPSRVIEGSKDATIVMSDVYTGLGLAGIPRGTVKQLRISSYDFAMRGMGGQVDRVGLDGPWDVRVIVGTVPVEPDGSAHFTAPAMVPLAVQPLDAEGKALQYMRSWLTCRPGEALSCVGCHETPGTAPPQQFAAAMRRAPSRIEPWYGPMRGFSFNREVQPVLDRLCIGCHNAATERKGRDGKAIADLTLRPDVHPQSARENYVKAAHFPPAYLTLKQYVRNATIESDAHMLTPCDYHADQTDLVRLLMKGHHGVELDGEAWDRIITWIDMNAPAHGSWQDVVGAGRSEGFHARRSDLQQRYGGSAFDSEAPPLADAPTSTKTPPVMPDDPTVAAGPEVAPGRFDPLDGQKTLEVALGDDATLTFTRIPAGEVTLGDPGSLYADERISRRAAVKRAFWIGTAEITNEQYARFNADHDSRLETGDFLQFSIRERGWPLNAPGQPVLRVSQGEAEAFCRWLSEKTGRKCSLPTEAQWVAAAEYGGYSEPAKANLADAVYRSVESLGFKLPDGAIPPWRPADETIDDGHRVSASVGSYSPNNAGIYDLRGNVAEWTCSPWPADESRIIAKGGSWRDVPYRSRIASRVGYKPYMKVIDVGFRVVIND